MAYENLLLDVSDMIATVTINRPKSLNALNRATVKELSAVLHGIALRDDVGVVLLTGAGEKAFVAGADITEMRDFSPVQAKDYPGLIANRVLMPMIIEAVYALMEGGGRAEEIDATRP